jgi:hypothetical protein
MKGRKTKITLGIILFLLVIQVFSIDKTNPKVDPNVDMFKTVKMPVDVEVLLKNACADCHSYETKYPWYTSVEPISWLIKGHINGGRDHFNMSEWQSYDVSKKNHKVNDCMEVIEKKWMPMATYTWMHPKAKLSDADRKRLIVFFESLRE